MNKEETITLIDSTIIELINKQNEAPHGALWKCIFDSLSTIKTALKAQPQLLFSDKPRVRLYDQLAELEKQEIDYPNSLDTILDFYHRWLLSPLSDEARSTLDIKL